MRTRRFLLLLLAAVALTQCRAVRRFSPYEVYRSANCLAAPAARPEVAAAFACHQPAAA